MIKNMISKRRAELGYTKLILIILALLLLLFLVMWIGKSAGWIENLMPKIFRIGR